MRLIHRESPLWTQNARRRWLAGIALVVGLGTITLWTEPALSDSSICSGSTVTLPGALIPVCAGEPARARDMNHNLRTIAGWIENKVGVVSSPDVAVTGDLTVEGAVNVPEGSFTGADIANGAIEARHLSSLGCTAGQVPVRRSDDTWGCVRRAPSLTDEFSVEVRAPGGQRSQDALMVPANGLSFCFLTRVDARENDVPEEPSECRVLESGSNWILRASAAGNSWALCSARCAQW